MYFDTEIMSVNWAIRNPPVIPLAILNTTNTGMKETIAAILGNINRLAELTPIISSASICSVTRMVPISEAMFDPTLPAKISGGMQKRVAIARAIALNPKYLFCDEPNSGLDPKTSILIDELLSDITHEYNITTIIKTHDMNSVIGIGENIVFINKGHREWVGNRAKIFTSSNEALNDFVFATRLFKEVKGYMIEEYRKHESADE